ncbi:TPA: hypothetical protein OTT35_000036 [Citrobacter koseri]|nr:hypothetical protein [Citrobacter koseri]
MSGTDMRKSFNGLGELVQHALDENPFSGHTPENLSLSDLADDSARSEHGLMMLVGKGGAGKTTMAATIAVRSGDIHSHGQKVVVFCWVVDDRGACGTDNETVGRTVAFEGLIFTLGVLPASRCHHFGPEPADGY